MDTKQRLKKLTERTCKCKVKRGTCSNSDINPELDATTNIAGCQVAAKVLFNDRLGHVQANAGPLALLLNYKQR
jgi:hypothetical protein